MTNNWIPEESYNSGNKNVLDFINGFMMFNVPNEEMDPWDFEDMLEPLRMQFRAGYCYYFAHMLKTAFGRGEVCWAAPFGHMVWVDTDGTPYDIEGIYYGEHFYMIPEHYMGTSVNDFKHNGTEVNSSAEELIKIMQNYCDETGVRYNRKVEEYLKG